MADSLAPVKPAAFGALRLPGYRMYLATYLLTMMADNIEHVLSYWVAFQKFHSEALGGFAVVSHWLPFLAFAVPVGALNERIDSRRIIQAGAFLFITASAGWGYFFVTGTLIMKTLGPTHGILLNTIFYLPLILWLVGAPYGRHFRGDAPPPKRSVRGLGDIIRTIEEVRKIPVLAIMIALAGGASFFIGNSYQAQMPHFAQDLGHGDPGTAYAMLLGADAAGALLAGILLESRGGIFPMRPQVAIGLAIGWATSLACFALSRSYPLALCVLFCAGFFELSFSSMAQTLVQMNAPEQSRGRVLGLYNMAAAGLRTFSGVTVGLAGSLVGVHVSLAAAAGCYVLSMVAARIRIGRWATAP